MPESPGSAHQDSAPDRTGPESLACAGQDQPFGGVEQGEAVGLGEVGQHLGGFGRGDAVPFEEPSAMAIVLLWWSRSIGRTHSPVRERFGFREASTPGVEAQRSPSSLALFPPLLVDTQSFGELVFQDDDPAGRLERGALVNELTRAGGEA
jgi:hypothetical protein